MKKRNTTSMLRFVIPLFWILFCLFPGGAWAQAPSIVNMTPSGGAVNVLINTQIIIQFDRTMNTGNISVKDNELDYKLDGTTQWRTTVSTNDTFVFTLQNPLRPGGSYYYEGDAQSGTGGARFEANFLTKPSSADVTPPTVWMVYPYNTMTGVSTGQLIHIKFSELMNPSTINSTNITISSLSSSDYSVMYSPEDGWVEIRKNTPFSGSTTYTVTITTNVRDLRGNPLKQAYAWTFTTTDTPDLISPTVLQRIPTGTNDVFFSPNSQIHIIFSEMMDESTIIPANITLENESHVPVTIWVNRAEGDLAVISYAPLTRWHTYYLTLGTGIKDRAGNGLEQPYTFYFSVQDGVNYDPVIYWGTESDGQIGQRWGVSTKVDLELGAWDDISLAVTATDETQPPKNWTLSQSPTDVYQYSYSSPGDESLSSGTHILRFDINDGTHTVTFRRNIFIFDASPVLSSPNSGATGVSTTPTFEWTYGGSSRPLYYYIAVFVGPNPDKDKMVWVGNMGDHGSGTHSITIPADKKLAPNTTYYWGVNGTNYVGNGETISEIRPFTTGGTPPPLPSFGNVYVRGDNRTGGMRWNVLAYVRGPSPADIAELKVTGPGGFQYIFTEDDISQSEQIGLYYAHDIPSSLSNGTYTFSVTDSQGRTATANTDFSSVSVPYVGTGTMGPVDNTYINSTTHTFSWGSVGEGYYYRLVIFDWNSTVKPLYMSLYTQDTQATVPEGYLLANTPYKWCVDTYDSSQQNRSRSDTLRFSTGSSSYVLDLNFGGVWSDNVYYGGQRKSINAIVIGPLPNHVQTPPGFLTVTGPGGFTHTFSETEVAHSLTPGNPYSYGEPGFALDGNYTFTVQDINSATDTPIVKNVTTAEIPIVDQTTMLPANNAYLNNLTPTFSWTAVSGGNRYYRVTINDWNLRYTIYQSSRSAAISVAIPPGILRAHRSYKWRVEVFDSASGSAADNRSTSAWNCFTTPRRPRYADFDGDSTTDVAVYDVANGWWYLHNSKDGGYVFDAIGVGGGSQWKPVAGDYDGDGKSDVAVYDAEYGWWLFHYTAGGYFYDHIGQGGTGYTAVPGNYDADGVTDIAVYNQTNGYWYIKYSNGGYGFDSLGGTGSIPVTADFDGDGKTDVAVYDVANGWWYFHYSSDGSYVFDAIGVGGGSQWKPVPGDYDGDGKADVAVYDAQYGWWLFHYSSGGYFYDHIGVGGTGYGAVPGDYDGDGVTDIAVYNETNGYWYVKYSSGKYGFDSLGGTGSVPVNPQYLLGLGF